MTDGNLIELANGLRVVYKYVPYTRIVHCGYVINAGSRDDLDGEAGMAHFIEHMAFKGTAKRKTFHVLNYLDSVGGDVNAYTTKEKTCFYASLMSEYFERAVELLTDITFYSTFPEKEIAKEKQVISEEIDMYRDSPDEAIIEDFDQMIFPDHGLGYPILGTKDSITDFDQGKLIAHIRRTFAEGRVVFGIVGNVTEKEVKRVIDKYLAPLEMPSGVQRRLHPLLPQLNEKKVEISTEQAHETLGGRAYALRRELHAPFTLINNLLGGPAMNARLNLNIRERYGLTYTISSFYSPFLDTGIWGVYYACDPANVERIRRLVMKELRVLWEKPLGPVALSQAKRQLVGQLTLGNEYLLNQMLGMSKDVLDFGQIISFASYLEEIEAINVKQVQQTAEEIFRDSPLSLITYMAS